MSTSDSSGFSFGKLAALIIALLIGIFVVKVVFAIAMSMLMWLIIGAVVLAGLAFVVTALAGD